MTARSKTVGRPIVWTGNYWVYEDTGKRVPERIIRPCPHCGEKPVGVRVKIPADLSHTGKAYWKVVAIDHCIAPIVEALQQAGINMKGSCCGHGKREGSIVLQDGRELVIKTNSSTERVVERRGRMIR